MPEQLYWLIPILSFALVLFGVFRSRGFLVEVARRAHNQKVFFERDTPVRELESAPMVSGDVLSGEGLEKALYEIATFAKSQRPDWILGVHVGGRFLSVAITHLLGLSPKQCLFVSTHRSRNSKFTIESEGEGALGEISGSMLVVDDISRTGATLRDLKNFLHARNYAGEFKLSKVIFAVLVIASESGVLMGRFRPDWFYFKTLLRYFRLPWTDLSLAVQTAYDQRERGKELIARGQRKLAADWDGFLIDDHERQARSFNYALDVARKHLPIDAVSARLRGG